jgi:hypothetical protein
MLARNYFLCAPGSEPITTITAGLVSILADFGYHCEINSP